MNLFSRSPSSHSLTNEWDSSWNSGAKSSKVTSPKDSKKSKRKTNDTQEGLLVNFDEQNSNKNEWNENNKKEHDAWESLNN